MEYASKRSSCKSTAMNGLSRMAARAEGDVATRESLARTKTPACYGGQSFAGQLPYTLGSAGNSGRTRDGDAGESSVEAQSRMVWAAEGDTDAVARQQSRMV